jgi:hypothetical protein
VLFRLLTSYPATHSLSINDRLKNVASYNIGPANKAPVLLNTSGQSHLFANLCASGRGERQTGSVSLDGNNLGARSGRTNVDHKHFVLCKLRNLGLLAVCGLDSEQSSKEEVVDLELSVNVGKMAAETKDKTNETIGTTQSRVYACTNT